MIDTDLTNLDGEESGGTVLDLDGSFSGSLVLVLPSSGIFFVRSIALAGTGLGNLSSGEGGVMKSSSEEIGEYCDGNFDSF